MIKIVYSKFMWHFLCVFENVQSFLPPRFLQDVFPFYKHLYVWLPYHTTAGIRSVQRTQRMFCWTFALLNDCSHRVFVERKQMTNWSVCCSEQHEQRWRCAAHKVFAITQKYFISPRLWAIREEFEYISDTWPFAEQWSFSAQTVSSCKQKTKRSLYWTQPW